jgi:two-component system, LytTR family, response regulator LytT
MENISKKQFYGSCKQFSKETLTVNLEILLHNFYSKNSSIEMSSDSNSLDFFFIRDRGWLKKVNVKDIEYLKTEGSYTIIITKEKEFTLRSTIKEIKSLKSALLKKYLNYIKSISCTL